MGQNQASQPDPATTDLAAVVDETTSNFGRRRRYALVLGNSSYKEPIPALRNPSRDATALGRKLERDCAFEVTKALDLSTRQQMEEAVDSFCDKLSKHASGAGSAGFFFYAGHAVDVDGQNYLLPTGMPPIRKRVDVKYHALPLEFLLERLDMANNGFNVVVLDCCREDPFKGPATRGVARRGGLAAVSIANARGTMICYSCSPGAVAADSSDQANSVYTAHLIKSISLKRSLYDVFTQVAKGVLRDTNQSQMPWILSSMTEDARLTDVQEVPTQNAITATYDESMDEQAEDAWGMLESLSARYPNTWLYQDDEEVTIGRSETCTISIPDTACVSRVHCRIFRGSDDKVYLEDLSSNGTWVNRKLVGKKKKVVLKSGQTVTVQKANAKSKISKIAFKFLDADDASNNANIADTQSQQSSDPAHSATRALKKRRLA